MRLLEPTSDIFSNSVVTVTEKIRYTGIVNFNCNSKEIHNLNLIVIEMKSSITNCNSNEQLLQLVPIQLLQKATSRHPK